MCVSNDDLKKEWEKYLEQTTRHEQIVLGVLRQLGLDPERETPGRHVVRHIGESLVAAMEMALAVGPARGCASSSPASVSCRPRPRTTSTGS